MSDPFNCPKCGAHDYGLFAASLVGCPHCNKTELTALRARLADIESQAGDATEYVLAQINLELRGMVVDARAKLAAAEREVQHLRSEAARASIEQRMVSEILAGTYVSGLPDMSDYETPLTEQAKAALNKLEAAERDAARYRHLRSLRGLTVTFRDHVRFKTSSGNKLIEVRTIGEYDLDAALDAMAPRSGGEGEQS